MQSFITIEFRDNNQFRRINQCSRAILNYNKREDMPKLPGVGKLLIRIFNGND